MKDADFGIIDRVSRRIEAFTGLSVASVIPMTVANYGIGGFYRIHYDHVDGEVANRVWPQHGNRFASWLTYIGDVQAGTFNSVFQKIFRICFTVLQRNQNGP